tara:strand:- start:35 stop:277 length:243 start_codon:yes stop_codon:yes gene_type:complete
LRAPKGRVKIEGGDAASEKAPKPKADMNAASKISGLNSPSFNSKNEATSLGASKTRWNIHNKLPPNVSDQHFQEDKTLSS